MLLCTRGGGHIPAGSYMATFEWPYLKEAMHERTTNKDSFNITYSSNPYRDDRMRKCRQCYGKFEIR